MRSSMPVFLAAIAIVASSAFSVMADAPRMSPRPQPRPAQADPLESGSAAIAVYYRPTVRPRPRNAMQSSKSPDFDQTQVEVMRGSNDGEYMLATTRPVYTSPRPTPRPQDIALSRTVTRIKTAAESQQSRVASVDAKVINTSGTVCGDPRIRGTVLAPIKGKQQGCGLTNPIKVTSIDGVQLSQASIMDCQTAKTLTGWVTKSVRPTVGRRGGGLAAIKVAAHYSCRTRNSQKGAKISEHGKGHAIDISGFTFANGTTVTVLDGWNNRRDKKLLASLRAQACGPFGTVLGPGSDRFHDDHFHLDTARYRSGAYCR